MYKQACYIIYDKGEKIPEGRKLKIGIPVLINRKVEPSFLGKTK